MNNENIITENDMMTINETQHEIMINHPDDNDYRIIHDIMQTLIDKLNNDDADDIPRIIIKTLKNAYMICAAIITDDGNQQTNDAPNIFLTQILKPFENELKNMITLNDIKWLLSDECLTLIGNDDYKPSKETLLKALLCKHYMITLPDAESYSRLLMNNQHSSALSMLNMNDDYKTLKLKSELINNESEQKLNDDNFAKAVRMIHAVIDNCEINIDYNNLLLLNQTLNKIIELGDDYDNILEYVKSAHDDMIGFIDIMYDDSDRIWLTWDELVRMICDVTSNLNHATIPCIIMFMLFIADYDKYIEPFKEKSLSKHNMLTLLEGIQNGYPDEFITQQVMVDYNESMR